MTFVQRLKTLFSFRQLLVGIEAAVRRFPAAIAIAIAGTICGIAMIESEGEPNTVAARLLFTFLMGFPLLVGVQLLVERLQWNLLSRWLAHIVALLVLLAYWFFLPAEIFAAPSAFMIRSLLWGGSFLLFIPLATVLSRKSSGEDFWESSATVLSAAVIAFAFGMVIFLGVIAAIGSVDALFELNIDETLYPDTWAVAIGIIASTLFLASLPLVKDKFLREEFLAPWRVLSLYILVPLVCVYFVILYVYLGSVILDWEWPESLVSYLIIAFSLVGIFSAVALHDLREKKRWLTWFVRLLFVAIIPQAFVLLWAIWFPLSNYGFTEKRYMVVLFGLWLIVMSLYYLISRKKDWRVIPASLILIMVLSTFGPWSALAVSERSQVSRLLEHANALGMVNSGQLVPLTQTLPDSDEAKTAEREISAILRYLINTHGVESIKSLLPADVLDGVDTSAYHGEVADLVVTDLGLTYRYDDVFMDKTYFNYYSDKAEFAGQRTITAVEIAPYDYTFSVFAPYMFERGTDALPQLTIDDVTYGMEVDLETQALVLTAPEGKEIQIDFQPFVSEIVSDTADGLRTVDEMTLYVDRADLSAKILFDSIDGQRGKKKVEINNLSFTVYLTIK